MKHLSSMLVRIACAAVFSIVPACKGESGGASGSAGAPGGLASSAGGGSGDRDGSGHDAGGVGLASGGGSGGIASVEGASSGAKPAGGEGGRAGAGHQTSSANKPQGGVQAIGGRSLTGGSTPDDTGDAGAGLTLYYVRHAEVVANTLDVSQVTLENADTLTDLGLRQAEALGTYLQEMGVTPDAILVSPHLRAQRTIEPYLSATNLPGEVWMELAEASDKPATGAPIPSQPKYIKYYKATLEIPNLTFRDPAAIEFWQNDNYESGLLMVMTARDLLLERYGGSGKTIFVVGHAIAGQMLIGLLRGDPLLNGPPTGTGAVYLLNTGVMKLTQDASTGLFKLDGRNINKPSTK